VSVEFGFLTTARRTQAVSIARATRVVANGISRCESRVHAPGSRQCVEAFGAEEFRARLAGERLNERVVPVNAEFKVERFGAPKRRQSR